MHLFHVQYPRCPESPDDVPAPEAGSEGRRTHGHMAYDHAPLVGQIEPYLHDRVNILNVCPHPDRVLYRSGVQAQGCVFQFCMERFFSSVPVYQQLYRVPSFQCRQYLPHRLRGIDRFVSAFQKDVPFFDARFFCGGQGDNAIYVKPGSRRDVEIFANNLIQFAQIETQIGAARFVLVDQSDLTVPYAGGNDRTVDELNLVVSNARRELAMVSETPALFRLYVPRFCRISDQVGRVRLISLSGFGSFSNFIANAVDAAHPAVHYGKNNDKPEY